jgi:hypothetical protein
MRTREESTVKLRTYAMKPMGDGNRGALACVSTISPWAAFGATRVEVRHTGNAGRPMSLLEGSTV